MAGDATAVPALGDELRDEVARLERELEEIDLLVQQVRTESGRHAQKRTQALDRLAAVESRLSSPPELRETTAQAVAVTRRASLMEAQVDVLEGKQKALRRYRDRLAALAAQLDERGSTLPAAPMHVDGSRAPGDRNGARSVLEAQEGLRREIARQMHDGPAQSLANIALKAQILERLLRRDPARAEAEVTQLISMVQQTLDATKNFIFDVRPMVLDDLGIVPTLRRAARDRGRRARIPIDFDSVGPDRRLAAEVESALFRIVDDALVAYLGRGPERIGIRLEWTDDEVRASIEARYEEASEPTPAPTAPAESEGKGRRLSLGWRPGQRNEPGQQADLPPALAAMIDEQRDQAAAATAERELERALPEAVWAEIEARGATMGVEVARADGGRTLTARVATE